jgi:Xaa-Pro dipeptidase
MSDAPLTNQAESQNEQNESQYAARQARLAALITSSGLNALALNPGPSLTYLTGLHFHLMERPVTAIFTPNLPPVLVLPDLESAKVEALSYDAQIFPYGEDPAEWQAVFRQAAMAAQIEGRQVGVEPGRLRLLELRYLENAAPQAEFISAEDSLAALRMRKEEDEIAAMRQAARIAQQALNATLPLITHGVSERQIASELVSQLLRAGSEPQMPFFPIVSGGPNSANPHATPSERPLAAGDLLVIDWGASYKGYVSDITRTFAIGPVEEEFELIAKLVLQANTAGRAAAAPGVTAAAVDHAARQVIDQAGYGNYFIHRTGHGIGMEGHEPPYIRAGNSLPLDPGMTFTVEPGIYLPQRGGVRIEDDMVITDTGAESLTDMPRQLKII